MKRLLILSLLCVSLLTSNAQKHVLPKHLNYEAFEPIMDSLSMYIHINSYHKKYIDLLNKSVAGTPDSSTPTVKLLIRSSKLSEKTRLGASGDFNHALFWEILTPDLSTKPSPELNTEIVKYFYSVDSMKTLVTKASASVLGSGWVWVIVTPDKKLQITTTQNEDSPVMDKIGIIHGIPLFGIDLWEHSYFMKYHGDRTQYVQSVLKLLDWTAISKRNLSIRNTDVLTKMTPGVDWPAFVKFRDAMKGLVMNMQKGEMQPIRAGSSSLLTLAKALDSESIPTECATDAVKGAIKNILSTCTEVNDIVIKKGTDAQIKEKLTGIKEPFKIIVTSFSKKDDQYSHQ